MTGQSTVGDAATGDPTLGVTVTSVPEPGLIRPAIEAVLAGRPWPDGPEATIARAVAEHGAREGGAGAC